MSDVPRRLPRTQPERIKNVARTRAALSGEGGSSFPRPVAQPAQSAVRYNPPTGIPAADLERLTVGYRIDDLTGLATPDGKLFFTDPTFTDEAAGGTVIVADSDGIGIYTQGVYAVNLWLNVTDIQAADPACSVRFFCDVSSPFGTGFDCGVRGGDARSQRSILASTSRTYYIPADGSAVLTAGVAWANLDTTNVATILAEVQVQRIVA